MGDVDNLFAELSLVKSLVEHARDPLTLNDQATFGLFLFLEKLENRLNEKMSESECKKKVSM